MSFSHNPAVVTLALSLAAIQPSDAANPNPLDAYERGDFAEAAQTILTQAQAGDPDATYLMGILYQNGEGVPKSATKAILWFRLAAQRGSKQALTSIGYAYQNGDGVPKNESEAISWFQKAAALNDSGAMHALALSYANGLGVERDATKAAKWFKSGALLGDFWCMNLLALAYDVGQGVEVEKEASYAWYNVAAARDTTKANRDLAIYSREKVAKQLSPAQLARAQEASIKLHALIANPSKK